MAGGCGDVGWDCGGSGDGDTALSAMKRYTFLKISQLIAKLSAVEVYLITGESAVWVGLEPEL